VLSLHDDASPYLEEGAAPLPAHTPRCGARRRAERARLVNPPEWSGSSFSRRQLLYSQPTQTSRTVKS